MSGALGEHSPLLLCVTIRSFRLCVKEISTGARLLGMAFFFLLHTQRLHSSQLRHSGGSAVHRCVVHLQLFFPALLAAMATKVPIRMLTLLSERALPLANIRRGVVQAGCDVPSSMHSVRRGWRRQRLACSIGAFSVFVGSTLGLVFVLWSSCDRFDECLDKLGWDCACAVFHVFVSIPGVFAACMLTFARISVFSPRLDGLSILFPGLLDFRAVPKVLSRAVAAAGGGEGPAPKESDPDRAFSDEETMAGQSKPGKLSRRLNKAMRGTDSKAPVALASSDIIHIMPVQR